jgi:hypothetical protein
VVTPNPTIELDSVTTEPSATAPLPRPGPKAPRGGPPPPDDFQDLKQNIKR